MYKMIMVPTDGSGFDREAIQVALRVAERSRAKVQLVRVHSTGAFFGMGSSPDAATFSVEVLQQERDRILSELYALAAECRNTSDAEIDVALEDGPVPDALQAFASRNKVDLIVIKVQQEAIRVRRRCADSLSAFSSPALEIPRWRRSSRPAMSV